MAKRRKLEPMTAVDALKAASDIADAILALLKDRHVHPEIALPALFYCTGLATANVQPENTEWMESIALLVMAMGYEDGFKIPATQKRASFRKDAVVKAVEDLLKGV